MNYDSRKVPMLWGAKITIKVKFSSVCAMKSYFGSGVGRSGPIVCSVPRSNSDRTNLIDCQSVFKCP